MQKMLRLSNQQQQHPSDIKIHQATLVVMLLSCSWTYAVAFGPEEATSNRPEARTASSEGPMVELRNSQDMQFLKQFMVFVVKEAMLDQGIRCQSEADQDLKVLRLIEGAVQLIKNLELAAAERQKTSLEHAGQGGAGWSSSSPAESSKEDVKKSAADVYRDHKLKTLFRWGKRSSSD